MITINQQTKISSLIKANKDSIEAIASLAAPMEKLKNPLLRKLLAGRITLSEAAKMGDRSIWDFARVLQPLGFVFQETTASAPVAESREEPKWVSARADTETVDLDVRPMLTGGIDPLIEIMQIFRELRPGGVLCIVNSFVPTPLIKLLEKQNAESFTKTVQEGEVRTYFLKTVGPREKRTAVLEANEGSRQKLFKDDARAFAEVCKKYPADRTHAIDVVSQEMPLPMHTILRSLKDLPDDHALYVYHKRTPVYLLEELTNENYEIHILTISDTDTRLLLFKNDNSSGQH
jgi:uncharacterized protein (DUF2249 family)